MSEKDPLQLHDKTENQSVRESKLRLPTIPGIFRAIPGIQKLVVLSIIAACGRAPGTEGPTGKDAGEIIQADPGPSEKADLGYSPERYPTIESRKKYLLEKYGIIVKEYDEQENRQFKRENQRRFESCDTIVRKDKNLLGMEVTKVAPPKKATPSKKEKEEEKERKNNPMLTFLDDICRASDTYPKSLFAIKRMEVVMAEDILVKDSTGKKQQSGGYASQGKRMVVVFDPMPGRNESVFRHEFFHLLDQYHQDRCKDDDIWRSGINKGRKYYGFKNGFIDTSKSTEGNAAGYGSINQEEDQATMGEAMADQYELRILLHRAKKDPILLKKMEAISGCKIDPVAGRFLRTMTEDEYRTETGYDRYYYYYSWSKDMDAKYWNAMVDKNPYREHVRAVRPAGAPRKNKYDIIADNLDYEQAVIDEISGDGFVAAKGYWDAHEPEIAQKLLIEYVRKWEKEGKINVRALAYDFKKAGMPEKARTYYAQAAKEAEKEGDLDNAMQWYFEAGNDVDGQRVAEVLFKAYRERYEQYHDFNIHNTVGQNDSMNFYFSIESLKKMKKLPKIAIDLLKKIAEEYESKGNFSGAMGEYETIGDQEKIKEMAYRELEKLRPQMQTKRGKYMYAKYVAELYEAIGQDDTAREYFMIIAEERRKMKFFEDAAELYEKAGRIDIAIQCLLSSVDGTKKEDPNSTYVADLYHQIADLQRKLDGE